MAGSQQTQEDVTMNSTPENARSLPMLSRWKNSLYVRSLFILIVTLITALYLRHAPLISSGKAHSPGFEPALVTPYMFTEHAVDVLKNICALNDRLADNEHAIFLERITVIQSQLGYTRSNISHLINRYQLLRHHYHEHNSSAAKALKVLEPNGLRRRAILGGYETWAYLGLNFTKMYWDPWVEARNTAEVAHLALAALIDEMSRLEKITRVALETSHHLNRLAYVVHGGPTEGNVDKRTVEARDILMRARHLWGGLTLEEFKIEPTVSALLLDLVG